MEVHTFVDVAQMLADVACLIRDVDRLQSAVAAGGDVPVRIGVLDVDVSSNAAIGILALMRADLAAKQAHCSAVVSVIGKGAA